MWEIRSSNGCIYKRDANLWDDDLIQWQEHAVEIYKQSNHIKNKNFNYRTIMEIRLCRDEDIIDDYGKAFFKHFIMVQEYIPYFWNKKENRWATGFDF